MFREVARKKQSLSKEEMIQILRQEKRGVLSLHGENGYPYGLPINYYYNEENGCIYFHSGKKGHRTDALKKDSRVCYCVYDKGTPKEGHWSLNVKSVIVFGRIELTEDLGIITKICAPLSRKFTSDEEYISRELSESAKNTLILKLTPEHVTGKLVNEA